MTIPSIGFFYNADIRNNGTARRMWDAYVRMGGKDAGGKRYRRPVREDRDEHDLYVFVDDGRDDIPMEVPGRSACWLVDTHLGFETRRDWASKFDTVFCAQKPGAEALAKEGMNAHWLPLACHPPVDPSAADFKVQATLDGKKDKGEYEKAYDLAFVGFYQKKIRDDQHDRLDFLDRMFTEFPNSWMSTNVFFAQAALRYVRARIGLNISILDDLNMRFFEVLSYGSMLLTNTDVVGWKELGFEDGVHFVGYTDTEDAIEKARFYLDPKNVIKREKIARQGHLLVRSEHTYGHRLNKLIEVAGA